MADARELAREQWNVRCALCKKPGNQHNSTTRACPIGRKHRTFGYSSFHSADTFTDAPSPSLSGKTDEPPQVGGTRDAG